MTHTQRQIEEHRTGEARIEVIDPAGRPCAGVRVWAEQETHAYAFGCVAPDLGAVPEAGRERCLTRLHEVFNRVAAGPPPDPVAVCFEVPDAVLLGRLRFDLDRVAAAGLPLDVVVRGRSVGLGPEAEGAVAERAAALYALCFAHPAVRGIWWEGVWDGEEGADGCGLLRLDFAPRPAFRFLDKLIGSVWHTRASGETDREGRFGFHGFFGDYRVATRVGSGAAITALFSFRGGPTASLFRLRIPERIDG